MECCYMNYLNTTTMITIVSGTSSVSYLYDRGSDLQYQTSGENGDAIVSTIRIEFPTAQNVSRICLENINLKSFKIYHSSNSANLLTLQNAATNASSWAQNSETSLYLIFATVSASIFTLVATTTIIPNEEKKIGEFWFLNKCYSFENNPQSNDFEPSSYRKEYRHELSDGGVCTYVIQDNFKCNIKRKYVSNSERSSLKTLHQLYNSFVFVPFPTGTAWQDEPLSIYAVNWIGDFGFNQYTDNIKGNGFSGSMRLEELPR